MEYCPDLEVGIFYNEKYKEKYNPFKVKVEIEYPFEGVL